MTFRTLTTICLVALLAGAALAGEIAGTLRPAGRVTKVTAIDRDLKRTYTAKYDATTGEYRFRNLPRGVYDVVLETKTGRIEGVNLRVAASEPKGKPQTLKPSELDRGEILNIAAYLKKLLAERKKVSPDVAKVLVRVRQTKPASCALVGPKPAEGEAPVHVVPLEEDEVETVGQLVLGMVSLVKVRDSLPRDFDLFLDVEGDKAGDILLAPASPELTEADRKWLIDWVDKIRGFENKRRVLDLDGSGQRAKVLVEKLRDKPTTLPTKEPAAFWRVEIFDFKKYYGGWNKEKYTVVVREQVPIRRFRTYRWMFEKRLGGIAVEGDGITEVPAYEVPEKLDPDRGRLPF